MPAGVELETSFRNENQRPLVMNCLPNSRLISRPLRPAPFVEREKIGTPYDRYRQAQGSTLRTLAQMRSRGAQDLSVRPLKFATTNGGPRQGLSPEDPSRAPEGGCTTGRYIVTPELSSTQRQRMVAGSANSDEKRPGQGRQRIDPGECRQARTCRGPGIAANHLLHRGLRRPAWRSVRSLGINRCCTPGRSGALTFCVTVFSSSVNCWFCSRSRWFIPSSFWSRSSTVIVRRTARAGAIGPLPPLRGTFSQQEKGKTAPLAENETALMKLVASLDKPTSSSYNLLR